MLNQISVGQHFGENDLWYTPLNQFVDYGIARFNDWFYRILDVPDAEAQFNADEYLDHSLPHRPIIYISPSEVYSMHSLLQSNADTISSGPNDPLSILLRELGGVPQTASAELEEARACEIELTLKGKLETPDDSKAEEKALFSATKRYVLYLLKVQPAENLLQALVADVAVHHEEAWRMVLQEEVIAQQMRQAGQSPNLNQSALEDLTS